MLVEKAQPMDSVCPFCHSSFLSRIRDPTPPTPSNVNETDSVENLYLSLSFLCVYLSLSDAGHLSSLVRYGTKAHPSSVKSIFLSNVHHHHTQVHLSFLND